MPEVGPLGLPMGGLPAKLPPGPTWYGGKGRLPLPFSCGVRSRVSASDISPFGLAWQLDLVECSAVNRVFTGELVFRLREETSYSG